MAAVPAPRPTAANFRLAARYIFLTWPHNAQPKEVILANIQNLFEAKLAYAIVCEELHEDGIPHRHAVVAFKRKQNLKSLLRLDALAGSHGDYKACRDMPASIVYCKKDNHFIEFGDDPSPAAKIRPSDAIAKLAREGNDIFDIDKVFPAFVLFHKRKVDEYILLQQLAKDREAQPAHLVWHSIDYLDKPELWPEGSGWREICDWMDVNFSNPRYHREKQLYVWGKTGMGKSLLIIWLKQFFHIYPMPHSKWMNDLDMKRHQLLVCDEFNGCYPISFINEFVQGTDMPLETKGGIVLKNKNLPVIFLSNKPLNHWYKDDTDPLVMDALLDRFNMIEIKERAPFFQPLTLH
nr:MAG: replication associated protein [Arizlama virus]